LVRGGSKKFTNDLGLLYYVDDIKLEDCERGERGNSEMYREITKPLLLYITQQPIS